MQIGVKYDFAAVNLSKRRHEMGKTLAAGNERAAASYSLQDLVVLGCLFECPFLRHDNHLRSGAYLCKTHIKPHCWAP